MNCSICCSFFLLLLLLLVRILCRPLLRRLLPLHLMKTIHCTIAINCDFGHKLLFQAMPFEWVPKESFSIIYAIGERCSKSNTPWKRNFWELSISGHFISTTELFFPQSLCLDSLNCVFFSFFSNSSIFFQFQIQWISYSFPLVDQFEMTVLLLFP